MHQGYTTTVLSYRLPVGSEIKVSVGTPVNEGDILALTNQSFDKMRFNILSFRNLLKKVGDDVKKGDLVAQKKGLLGLFKKKFYSPMDGKIDSLDVKTGELIICLPCTELPFKSDVSGKVVEASDNLVSVDFKAIEIEAETLYNGKKVGRLSFKDPEGEMEGEILAIKDDIGRDFLFKASALGAGAVICSDRMKDLVDSFSPEKKIKVLSKEVSIYMPVFMVGDDWDELEKHEGKKIILDGDSKKIYLPS